MYLEKVNSLNGTTWPECDSGCCFCSNLLTAYDKLVKRHKKNITKNKRLLQLSIPKGYPNNTAGLMLEENKPRTYRRVLIVNKSDQLEHTRTEQLALPKVSQILELKRHPSFSSFHPLRKEGVDLLMKRSLHSVYSCLSNVMCKPKNERKRAQIKQNVSYVRNLAKPKKDFSIPRTPIRPPFSDEDLHSSKIALNKKRKFLRTTELAVPKPRMSIPSFKWTLTDAIRSYEPTERIIQMALPRKPSLNMTKKMSTIGSSRKKRRQSGTPQLGARLSYLAKPSLSKRISQMLDDNNPVKPKRKMRNINISARLLELSSPRVYLENTIRNNPYGISKSALKAKASARTKMLAVPLARRRYVANKT